MKSHRNLLVLPAFLLIACSLSVRAYGQTPPGVNVTLWDTGAPLGDAVELGSRAAWKAVPPDLLQLEADPPKSSSDPGYYGREYEFQGDAAVENQYLLAVVRSAKGTVALFSKADPGRKVAEFALLGNTGVLPAGDAGQTAGARGIIHCTLLQNTGDEAALELCPVGGKVPFAVLAFGKTPIVEIRPTAAAPKVRLAGSIAYGILPGFVGDDLILAPGQYPSGSTLYAPCENLFVGLLQGENSMLVMTWPQGRQQMRLGLSREGQGDRLIDSIDFDNDGQNVYLAVLEAPGIWHREILGARYLEKEVASGWKRPFPAKWVTELYEGQVRATYAFRDAAGDVWRGAAGRYNWPVWFNGDNAFYHLSKKVVPKGESIVYFLEGQNTPASVWTPVDILKDTLGRPACDRILDLAGRKLRTHHRRGAVGIRRACTCGCTEAIEAVFKSGQEIERKEYIEGAVGDMVYFVTRHMERLDEYRAFADGMLQYLRATAAARPELKEYLDNLIQIAQQIPEQYAVQKENIKSLAYTDELSRQTLALLQKKDPQNLRTCLELGKSWRGMGGAQDGLLAEYHIIARKLFQEAGSGCLNQPQAVDVAREIRNRCRQCLRNPDGYEIWPNY
jgi:hypothetical protein